ncbi:hypothetical protein GALL_533770 [mine drainage metagenome]|uniref:Uncharacterized protein n=1 Tax=mine drainage metagenome TaxID=410659 RepID=A0A1J5P1X6_9ZZZZ
MLPRRLFVFRLLQIVRQNHRGDPALTLGNADRPIDQVAHLRRHTGLHHERAGHVLEHALQVEFLLIVPTHRRPRLLSRNGHHRHVVHAGVVKAGDQVRRTRP